MFLSTPQVRPLRGCNRHILIDLLQPSMSASSFETADLLIRVCTHSIKFCGLWVSATVYKTESEYLLTANEDIRDCRWHISPSSRRIGI